MNVWNVRLRAAIITLATLTMTAATLAGVIVRPALADGTTYSAAKREFKVGILLLESTKLATQEARGPENPDPYVFYVADQRLDVKPAGWEFVNPLAPGTVTPDVLARWTARDPSRLYRVGQKVTKDMAAYWEVSLRQSSIQQLLQYDMLFITNHRTTAFSPAEREKLRKVVDAGGIVWIENCGGMIIAKQSPFFLEQLSFKDGGAVGTPQINKPDHPLLNTPYRLTFDEVNNLGDKQYTSYLESLDKPGQAPNPEVLVNIVGVKGSANLPYIAAGSYGGGTVIATASDCGCDINDYVGGVNAGSGGNSGAYSGTNFTAAHTEDLKFVYNMVAWGSSSGDFRRNNRRIAASFESVGAPLVSTFDFNNELTQTIQGTRGDVVESRTAGVIANGAYFVAGFQRGKNPGQFGKITVRAYDLNPLRDLDGDGNIDDGRADLSLGLPYDEIWRWDGPDASELEQPSPPVFASMLTATGVREERIYVSLPDGTLLVLQAFPRQGGSFTQTPGVATVAGTGGKYNTSAERNLPRSVAPAPVYFENRIYQVEPNGQVRCINAADNTLLWRSFKTAPGNIFYRATGTPAVGFVRQSSEVSVLSRNSGGTTNDLMMYIPTRVTEGSGNPTPPAQARMLAYWLGTRNEVLRFGNDPEAQNGVMKSRVAGGVAGGPSEGQYFVALPGNNAPLDTFLTPKLRVFAVSENEKQLPAQDRYTAQDRYNEGWTAYVGDASKPAYNVSIAEDGRITLALTTDGQSAKFPEPKGGADILVAADYDVMYISQKTGTIPPNYAANPTQIGARPNQLLNIASSFFRGGADAPVDFSNNATIYGGGYPVRTFTTPALAADDTLMFAAVQAFNPATTGVGTVNPPITTFFAVNEQEGDFLTPSNSRIKWRFPLTNAIEAGASNLTITRLVDDVSVTDIKPLVNYLQFDTNWPISNGATKQVTPEALTDIRVIGAPITTNEGITYYLGTATAGRYNPGRTMTVLMAFQTSPEIVLNLPEPFDLNAGVTVQQFDFLADQSVNPQGSLVRASSNQTDNPQMTLDADRGRIVVKNFRGSGSGFSASQSFVVRYYSRNGRAERKVVIPPTPQGAGSSYGEQVDATGRLSGNPGGFSPLLFYYVLPGQPISQPTLVGDYIYYNANVSNIGRIFALDARPFINDPAIRVGLSEPVLYVTDSLRPAPAAAKAINKINHVRYITLPAGIAGFSQAFAEGGPVGGEGSLVVNSDNGTFAFNNGVTLIADSRRLIEAGADGSALWSLESTIASTIAGGALPIFGPTGKITNPPAVGRLNQSRQELARPTSLQRIGGSDYLMADAGNNRVVRTDRGGNVVWSLTKAADPYQILAPGDPLTLNEPTDLLYYIAPSLDGANAVSGYEVHYLIADSGNNRIIEVANYYNKDGAAIDAPGAQGGGTKGQAVVVWVSRVASEQGKELKFRSVQRYIGVGPDGTSFAGLYGYPYLTAVVSNVRLGIDGPAADAVGGSLVTMRYAPYNTVMTFRDSATGAQKPGRLWLPAAIGSARATEPAGNGATLIALSEFTIITPDGKTRTKRINNPTFFQQLNLPASLNTGNPAKTLYLLCDLDGAFVLQARNRNGKPALDALWQFSQNDYSIMNRKRMTSVVGSKVGAALPIDAAPKFLPSSLQLLANGNYLITNAWTGRSAIFESGQFNGEVIEVKPAGNPVLAVLPFTGTAFGGVYANFSVPRIDAGGTDINNNVLGLNRQVMGGGDGNTGLLEQPIFAIRP